MISMNWYVLRTVPGKEGKNLLMLQTEFADLKILFPKRKLSWRKQGKIFEVIKPLFSGYLFVYTDFHRLTDLRNWLWFNQVEMWVVKSGSTPVPVTPEEIILLQRLTGGGEIVENSRIATNGSQVKIVAGPLVGLEGIVKRYSRRNRRIVVELVFGGMEKTVELDALWIS